MPSQETGGTIEFTLFSGCWPAGLSARTPEGTRTIGPGTPERQAMGTCSSEVRELPPSGAVFWPHVEQPFIQPGKIHVPGEHLDDKTPVGQVDKNNGIPNATLTVTLVPRHCECGFGCPASSSTTGTISRRIREYKR